MRRLAIATALAVCTAGLSAQVRPKADLTARPAKAVAAGARTTVVLGVALPPDVHVQADRPRDPSLIPTALTVTTPEGVTVAAIRYPKPTHLPQPGRSEALLVFGPAFEIAVDLEVAAGVAPGAIAVPARLRYQACDATTCFAPTRADVSWTLTVAAP